METEREGDRQKDELVESFLREAAPNVKEARKRKYRFTLEKLSREHLGKPFSEVTCLDLKDFIERLNNDDLEVEYAPWTKHDYRLVAKKFFSWLHSRDDPAFAIWIKIGTVEPTVGPEDILTNEELQRLQSQCFSLRDKALCSTLYESATRPHELLNLRLCDVTFEDHSAAIYIRKGKTGPRTVPIVGDAYAYLSDWKAHHPRREERDAPMWVDMSSNTRFDVLQYLGLKRFIERIAHDAKFRKRVTPYTFRHTRLTDLARKGFTEAQLCEFAGWKQGSDMPRMYIHLVHSDVRAALFKAEGIETTNELKLVTNTPKKCMRCGTVCASVQEMCQKCGMGLTLEAALKAQEEQRNRDERLARLESAVESIVATGQATIRSASEMGRSYRKLVGAPDLPEIKHT